MLRILHDTKVDFIRRWRLAAAALVVFILPAIVLIALNGFKYSIEFTGGTLMQVIFKEAPGIANVRAALSSSGLNGVEISTFGSARELVMRAQ